MMRFYKFFFIFAVFNLSFYNSFGSQCDESIKLEQTAAESSWAKLLNELNAISENQTLNRMDQKEAARYKKYSRQWDRFRKMISQEHSHFLVGFDRDLFKEKYRDPESDLDSERVLEEAFDMYFDDEYNSHSSKRTFRISTETIRGIRSEFAKEYLNPNQIKLTLKASLEYIINDNPDYQNRSFQKYLATHATRFLNKIDWFTNRILNGEFASLRDANLEFLRINETEIRNHYNFFLKENPWNAPQPMRWRQTRAKVFTLGSGQQQQINILVDPKSDSHLDEHTYAVFNDVRNIVTKPIAYLASKQVAKVKNTSVIAFSILDRFYKTNPKDRSIDHSEKVLLETFLSELEDFQKKGILRDMPTSVWSHASRTKIFQALSSSVLTEVGPGKTPDSTIFDGDLDNLKFRIILVKSDEASDQKEYFQIVTIFPVDGIEVTKLPSNKHAKIAIQFLQSFLRSIESAGPANSAPLPSWNFDTRRGFVF